MRGTSDKGLYDKFVTAVVGFPPTARDGKSAGEVFADSYKMLSELADPEANPEKKPFPRAIAWKAYALALSVSEGWPLPASEAEATMSPNDRLDLARDLASQAIGLDTTDYDLHWAMADVYLFRKDFDGARREFEIAIDLNRDERHPSLFAEAGSAMMQIGDLDKARTYFRKAMRRPDWHHWMRGILLFVEARQAGANEETFLNLALDELKGTHAQLGEDFYQLEIQLVLAAVYWRKWKLLSDKAAAMPEGESRALVERNAARNQVAADSAFRAFRATFDWPVDRAGTALPFNVAADRVYWLDTVMELWKIPVAK